MDNSSLNVNQNTDQQPPSTSSTSADTSNTSFMELTTNPFTLSLSPRNQIGDDPSTTRNHFGDYSSATQNTFGDDPLTTPIASQTDQQKTIPWSNDLTLNSLKYCLPELSTQQPSFNKEPSNIQQIYSSVFSVPNEFSNDESRLSAFPERTTHFSVALNNNTQVSPSSDQIRSIPASQTNVLPAVNECFVTYMNGQDALKCPTSTEAPNDVDQRTKKARIERKDHRYCRTANALEKSGLLDITLQTAQLTKKNADLQKDIDMLEEIVKVTRHLMKNTSLEELNCLPGTGKLK